MKLDAERLRKDAAEALNVPPESIRVELNTSGGARIRGCYVDLTIRVELFLEEEDQE